MDIPAFHFPSKLCPHTEKRNVFAGYGTVGGVNVCPPEEGTEPKLISQRALQWQNNHIFTALTPALPLRQPNKGEIEDHCMSEINKKRMTYQTLYNKLRIYKYGLPKDLSIHYKKDVSSLRLELEKKYSQMPPPKPGASKTKKRKINTSVSEDQSGQVHDANEGSSDDCIEGDDDDDDDESGSPGEYQGNNQGDYQRDMGPTFIPGWIANLKDLALEHIDDLPFIPLVNTLYTGGCLAGEDMVDKSFADALLFHPSGSNLENLCMSAVCSDSTLNGCISQEIKWEKQLSHKILEIDTARFNEQCYCCCRTQGGDCILLRASVDAECASCDVICQQRWSDCMPTSLKASHAILGESLVTLDNGKAYILAENSTGVHVLDKPEPCFCVQESWWSCDWASHPRQLFVTDRTRVAVYDVRGGKSRAEDLLTLPHPLFHSAERIMASVTHHVNPFYHLIATDFTLLMMDLRFPKTPVLHWHHNLQSPPQYMDLLCNSSEDVLLLGTQETAEVHAFQFSISQPGLPPVSSDLPWKLSRPGDMLHLVPEFSVEKPMLVDERVNCPLVGVTIVGCHGDAPAFVGFQMTAHGDIFYQKYQYKYNDGSSKTMAAVPGGHCVELPEWTTQSYRKWLQEIQFYDDEKLLELEKLGQDVLKPTFQDPFMLMDSTQVKKELQDYFFPHVLCALCSSQLQHFSKSNQDPRSLPFDKCFACGFMLDDAKTIKDGTEKDRVIDLGSISTEVNMLPYTKRIFIKKAKDYTDPNSEILRLLWEEDDPQLGSLLVKRDEYHEKWKREKKGKKIDNQIDEPFFPIVESDVKFDTSDEDDVDTEQLHSDVSQTSALELQGLATEGVSDEPNSILTTPAKAQRQRHMSGSSQSSVHSSYSLHSLGFTSTPERLKRQLQVELNKPSTQPMFSVLSSATPSQSTSLFPSQFSTPSQFSVPHSQSSASKKLSQSSVKSKRKSTMGF